MPERERSRCGGDEDHPERERPLRAEASTEQARQRSREEESQRARKEIEATLRCACVEAVLQNWGSSAAVRARSLDEVRDQHEGAEHREARDDRRDVREQNLPRGYHSHIDERLAYAELDEDPEDDQDGGRDEQRNDPTGRPTPRWRFGQGQQQGDQRRGKRQDTGYVDP